MTVHIRRMEDGVPARSREASATQSTSLTTTTTPVKLPRYDGTAVLRSYLAQVELAARHNSWSEEITAVHLALALKGKALQVLLDLPPSEQRDYRALTGALERRFGRREFDSHSREQLTNRRRSGEESIGAFAADVRFHARLGYPTFPSSIQEELALHAFIWALTPEELAVWLPPRRWQRQLK